MRKAAIELKDLRGVFSVPPLCRTEPGAIDWTESRRLVDHIAAGGITRLLYGGNAMLYHLTLAEWNDLLAWLAGLPDALWAIPSLGPSYGRAMDMAAGIARWGFPTAMMLPCNDPKDARGLERGLRAVSDAAGVPLVLYLKDENNFGPDRDAGLDVVARLVADGVCTFIKYAVVRQDPAHDSYLDGLLARVDRARVVSGIGERPAVVHLRDFGLPGFTTGSGCLAPRLCMRLYAQCGRADFGAAEQIRASFMPLEDIRDQAGPAAVLHAAVAVAEIARTGPLPPFVSLPGAAVLDRIAPVARGLRAADTDAP